ncbi:DgyrCDS9729 [Dimorphilus gyrociliatus]|uniref:DgyrCDS9729 n=1 Tax=Dimorphilus gyrociliatus TaxID=2664684 RepID=A0A7I8VXT7_9ANNE|nr:DgyrCDS9729 [Dimorphilus gyrociliatus]
MNSFIVGFSALVLCIASSSAQHSFGWNPNLIILKEAGPAVKVELGLIANSWPGGVFVKCKAVAPKAKKFIHTRAPNTALKWKPVPENSVHVIPFLNKKISIFFKAVKDGKCHDHTYKIKLTCWKFVLKNIPIKITNSVLTIKVKNTETGSMCDDPHLTQKVSGIDEDGESVTKDVCYDLYGKSGDQMELISDNVLGTSIVFELRDDYYIGKVFYATKLGYFNFTTDTISTSKSSSFKWKKEDSFVIGEKEKYPHAIISKNEMDVLIEYYGKDRSQSIRIAKIQQSFGKSYLNILIEKSTSFKGVFDEHHGGIFGLIANQDYEFYEPVQETIDLTVVKINGRFVKAFLTGKPGDTDRCYSMSLGDLMFPKNAYSFQKSL